jgi:transposase
MELKPLYPCVAGMDVPQAKVTVYVLHEDGNGERHVELRELGGCKRDRREMAEWIVSFQPEEVVMESTGIYGKSPYAALERCQIQALVVNARPVKQVPGRKTDIGDARWLAILARSGLLRGGFVPPASFRELRLSARQMQKRTGILGAEKSRLPKVLTDAGMRLPVVVSDLHGPSARAMVQGLIAGESPGPVLADASQRLKATEEERLDALEGEWTDEHRFVLAELMDHIEAGAAHRPLP